MYISRCCRTPVFVYSADEGTSFYVCGVCDIACDIVEENQEKKDLSYDLLAFSALSNSQ